MSPTDIRPAKWPVIARMLRAKKSPVFESAQDFFCHASIWLIFIYIAERSTILKNKKLRKNSKKIRLN